MGPRRRQQVVTRPCVFCGRVVEAKRAEIPPGCDTFAICGEDNARLDAALAALTADVLHLLDFGASAR